MKRYGYWLAAGLLWLSAVAHAQQQPAEDYVQGVTAYLQQETGETPQPQEIIHTLFRIIIKFYQDGNFRTVLTIAEQTYRFAEQALGPGHPTTLIIVDGLAALYESQGRYGEAKPWFQRALAEREKVLGLEHPHTLVSVNNLAALYDSQGRYGEAELLYQRALATCEKILGPEHTNTLISANNLASLYLSQGRYGEAEPLLQRALATFEKVLGPEHTNTLISADNLAGLYVSQGRYGKAEPLFQRSLAAFEKVLGPEHPSTLTSVTNLAFLYLTQSRYGKAEPLFQRALAALEKVLGPEHPDTLRSVNRLAVLYQFQGRYGEAEPLFQRALAALEKVLGPEHPDTLKVQLNYTGTLVNLNQLDRALRLLQRLEPRLLELAALRLRHTRQERVRRRFLTSQSTFQSVVLTLAMSHPEANYLELAARVMLRWKQVQGEEEAFLARLVRRRAGQDLEISALAEQIAALRRELSHLANRPAPAIDLQREKLNELEAKEIRLAQISHEFDRHLQVRAANADDVRDYLPRDGGALLELRQYQPVDFKTRDFGAPRWAALLLSAEGEMSLHDLGPVAMSRLLWQTLRITGKREIAAELYRNLFGELDEMLKRYDPLYLAPDGFLNLIAFARLVTPDGRYWIQRQTLRQVRTGRHLIAGYDRDLAKPKGLLALGGVDYDGFGGAAPPNPDNPAPNRSLTLALRAVTDEIGRFGVLEEAGKEATEVANSYWSYWNIKPQVWLGADAAEKRLKTLAAPPKVLHLATHGFYLSNNNSLVERPMVLSGLALAGANQGLKGQLGPHGEDGILYALEVQDLNLEDTELVALSACDTGVGTLDYSEGVYGWTLDNRRSSHPTHNIERVTLTIQTEAV